ncbi:TetR/AcrR family transcriptional regulator [Nisaea nitritireducens]|uniref:TetR/AcrR family transcriptional regulator n=1 Tax=Nisaea nitritireducens TaxID=568392 RepID=UPI001866B937|nr:TetR/AcrR family transcriptional regulator [Nisaea nitritireducens]
MAPVDSDKVLDAVLQTAGEHGWSDLTIEMVAERASLSASEIIRLYPGKRAILDAMADRFERQADETVDAEARDPSLPVPERLFDAIMTRFELLQEHRDGYAAIFGAARSNPCLALAGLARLTPAMGMVLRQTGLDHRGPLGCLRRKVLGALYISVLQVWLNDESEDLGPTMAALDKRLRQLDEIVASTPMRRKNHSEESSFSGR